MASILIVDDDEIIKEVIEQLLTMKGHQVVCATNGNEAMKIVERQTIDLVITDIIMPEMDGYELIRKLRKQPSSPKIIAISGGTLSQSAEALLDTALLMKADKILLKPFGSAEINDAVMEVLGRGCKPEATIFIQEIERMALGIGIPPCPSILLKLTVETKKNDPDFSNVEKLLFQDVALSATLIKTINSPLFGLPTKVSSVSQAVGLMGIETVTSAISNLFCKNVFADTKDQIIMERYWGSSAKLALATMHLAKRILGLNKDDAYTYGLLQNCGVPILMQRFPDYKETLRKANNLSEGKFTAVEDDAYGTDHATVSYLMTKSWNLPEVTARAIQFHHEYDMLSDSQTNLHSDSKSLIALGVLADHAVHLSSGSNGNFSLEWTKGGALALAQLDLSYSDFEDIYEDINHFIE